MEQTSTTYTERFFSYAFEGYDKESLGIAEKVAKVALALLCMVGVGLIPLAVTLTMDAVSYFENCNIVVEHPKPANQKPKNQEYKIGGHGMLSDFYYAKLEQKKNVECHLELINGAGSKITSDIVKDWVNEAKTQGKNFVFIPVVLNAVLGLGEAHFVVVTVDIANKQVEYFDPRGANPKWELRSVQSFKGNLQDLLNACKEAVDTTEEAKHNPTKFQDDSVSCGYFGCEYMERRSEYSFEDSIKGPYNIAEIREKVDGIVSQQEAETAERVFKEKWVDENPKQDDFELEDS